MAQQTIVSLVDDLDGSEATVTVKFGFDGTDYEIDLNDKHNADFIKKIGPYAEKARQAEKAVPHRGRRGSGGGRGQGRSAAARDESTQIRAWGKAHPSGKWKGLGTRGRIPADLVEAYYSGSSRSSNGSSATSAPEPAGVGG